MSDPFQGTRADVNRSFIHEIPVPEPENCAPKWTALFNALRDLFRSLAESEAMARNNTQPFSTPAHDKNAQYFCWDFIMRTMSYCLRADPKPESTSPQANESWIDANSRSMLIVTLILDEKPGQLAKMVEISYPGHNPGGQPPMSPEILVAARKVKDVLMAEWEKSR